MLRGVKLRQGEGLELGRHERGEQLCHAGDPAGVGHQRNAAEVAPVTHAQLGVGPGGLRRVADELVVDDDQRLDLVVFLEFRVELRVESVLLVLSRLDACDPECNDVARLAIVEHLDAARPVFR